MLGLRTLRTYKTAWLPRGLVAGAQVALQHCPILRLSASILSLDSLWRHNIYCVYLGDKRADLTALVFC